MKSKYKKYLPWIAAAAVVLGYVLWQTSGFVMAFRQEKRAHVFPTNVTAVGWENSQSALTLELPPQAPLALFNEGNSAFIKTGTTSPGASSGSQDDFTAPQTPTQPLPQTPPPATDGGTQVGSTTSAVTGVIHAAVLDVRKGITFLASQLISVALATTTDGDSSAAVGSTSAVLPPTPEPAQDTTASTTPASAPTVDAPAQPQPSTAPTQIPSDASGVSVCAVLGTACHTLEFSNFSVAGSLTDKPFEKAELNFSFANLSSAGGELDGKLTARYFHAGHWKSAGEIYLNKELSNATNGGYFSQVLDGVSAWEDLSDIRVVLEYEPGDGKGTEALYVDSVWIDAVYTDRVQDVLSGDINDPTDAPQNVAFSSIAGNKASSQLILDSGDTILFPYLDTISDDTLTVRSDASGYVQGSASSSTVYVSVTNPGKKKDQFTLFTSFPGGQGQVLEISQFLRNVPVPATSTVTSDVTYFCDGGWQAATTTSAGNYTCAGTGETYQCSSLNASQNNCMVSGVAVGVATSTNYASAWTPQDLDSVPQTDSDVVSVLPPGYTIAASSQKAFEILPGQTVYFRLRLATHDSDKQRFVLSAKGRQYFGDLDSMRLKAESFLVSQTKEAPKPKARMRLNDQISTTTDFAVDQLPSFHFKFKTQRSFFTRVKDYLTGTQVPYKVNAAQLTHSSGEVEHLPVDIVYGDNDEWTLKLEKLPRSFRPGKYTISLGMQEGSTQYSDALDFYWGVLAVNTNKSTYAPGENAHLSMAALDDTGNTMCNAQLSLTITDPSGNATDVPVVSGGGCGPNNVTTLPDYYADYAVGGEGAYSVVLSRLDDSGNIVVSTTDSFTVDAHAAFVVARSGPTRIYPVSPYSMHISVTATEAFKGSVTEVLPEGFTVPVLNGATLKRADGVLYLTWDTAMAQGETKQFSYTFKAPNISPYLYLLGPARLVDSNGVQMFAESRTWKLASDALSIATGVAWLAATTTTNGANINSTTAFPLSWSVSDDYDTTYYSHSTTTSPSRLTVNVAGDYLVAVTVPMERADTTQDRTQIITDIRVNGAKKAVGVGGSAFIRTTSGHKSSSDHLYVLLHNLNPGDYIESYVYNLTSLTDTVTIGTQASMYVEYVDSSQSVYFGVATTTDTGTNLNTAATSTMLWYDDSTLGRIDANYSHSNASTTAKNITLGQAGSYMVFINIPVSGTAGDSSVHGRVFLNGIIATSSDFRQGYVDGTTGATQSSIQWSGVVIATTTNEKLTVAVQQDSTVGTLTVGSDNASIYIQKLPSTDVYLGRSTALSGGTNWNVTPAQSLLWYADDVKDTNYYSHSTSTNTQQITIQRDGDYLLALNDSHFNSANNSRSNQITQILVNGSAVSGAQTKSHLIRGNTPAPSHNYSSGSLVYLLRNMVAGNIVTVTTALDAAAGTVTETSDALVMLWHKAAQSSWTQDTERWYANVNGEPPTDPWPSGAINLNQGDAITTGVSVKSGDVVRLRMALTANVNTVAGADSFKLQYAAGSTCSPALTWADVDTVGGSGIWRGYDNAGVAAGATLSSTTLTTATVKETYEEGNPSAATPNAVTAGTDAEWDWSLQDNGAAAGTNYCFRMVQSTGQTLKDYSDYPQLITNNAPLTPTLSVPFDNAKVASTSPWFQFTTTDDNNDTIHYEIQVSTDATFATTLIDQDTVSNFANFSDVTNPAAKSPYGGGDVIRFTPATALTNGTTYWWRVRAKDQTGTGTWSSYSAAQSITIDNTVTTSTWYQTTQDQFNEATFSNTTATVSGVQLSGSNTTGSVWSPEIDFSDATVGNSWGNLTWSNIVTGGTILYHIEYLTSTSSWAIVQDSDLAGNTAGTSTQPFKLTGLNPSTYAAIRVRADFTKSSATPTLQSWTVTWTNGVNQPSLTAPFDNEKTSTTTPTLKFTATEPNANNLVYQVQWSTDATFTTGITTRTSDTNSGFADVSSTTQSSPYASGDTVSYTLQSGEALTNGTTYWWRVRAKAPSGANAYSFWSSYHSFTVDTSVVQSTWYQRTFDQFNTDTLSRTSAISGGGATASSDTGKIAIYRAATAGESITTSTFNNGWDTTVRQDDVYSLTGTTSITLKAGYYAVLYGLRFDSTAGSNRSEIQTNLNLNGSNLSAGWSQGMISRRVTANQAFTSGGAIIKASSDNTPLIVQSFRTDTNPTATVARVANTSGVELIKLDSSWPYARLSKTTRQSGPVSTSWLSVTYDREDELNSTYYTHPSGSADVTLVSPGHYLVFANTYGSLTTNNDTMVDQKLTLNGSDVEGSFTTVYMRGNANSDGDYQGAASVGMIVESTSSNMVLNVKLARSAGTASWTINGNQAGSYVDRTALTIVKIPDADFVRLQNTTNFNINPTTQTALTWDTEAEKDASFSHSNGTNPSRMAALIAGDYLFMTSNYAAPGTTASAVFNQGWTKNGGTLTQYGQTGGINDTASTNVGHFSAAIFPSMSVSDYVEAVSVALNNTGTVAATKKAVQGLRIGSLVEADTNPKTIQSSDIVFTAGSGPKWAAFTVNDSKPASTSILYQVLYYNSASSTYALVPDAVLSGNSAGFTSSSSPISIANLNRTTYGTLRTQATFTCAAGNCPTLNNWAVTWSQGINISGTAKAFDQSTNVTSGTVNVAVNGVLQSGKTGSISGGSWSITNVTAFSGDIITVYVSTTSTSAKAVAVTKYLSAGDITGMALYQGHLTLGSDDAPTLTNTDIHQYDNSVSGNSSIFYSVTGGNLNVCAISGCTTSRLLIKSGTTFEPDSGSAGNVTTPYLQIDGTLVADGNTITVSKSWKNNGIFTAGASSVVFSATSTTETIDSTFASSTGAAFNNITLGSGSGSATWTLLSPLNASGTLAVNFGTFANGTNTLRLSGNLSFGASGVYTRGTGSTTFMGSGTSVWTDSSAAKQDVGDVFLVGTKTVQLGSAVKATNITIGSGTTLDASGSNYGIEVLGNWTNNSTFTSQAGTVTFEATTTGKTITPGSSSFYNLTFNGVGGNWAFSGSFATTTNNLTVTNGSVTLPVGTTTVGGNFDSSGGSFVHNNGSVLFNGAGAQTIRGGVSSFYDMAFNGSGSWSFPDNVATSSRAVMIAAGTVTAPSNTWAIGGSFTKSGGTFTHNSGTLKFTSSTAQSITLGGSSASSLLFSGSGSWTMSDANATTTNTVTIAAGAVTLPSGTLAVGGSFVNSGGSFTSNSGTVIFNASATGKSIAPGSSTFYNLLFNSSTGGWTITGSATSTNNTIINSASSFTLSPAIALAVGGTFSNLVGGAATTFTNSVLYLYSGTSYTLNTKSVSGDTYGTLLLGANTNLRMWNSSAATTSVPSNASLYSMNHAALSGALYIWGAFSSAATEYWSYATDFDGTALGGSSRAVSVRIASSSTVTLSGIFNMVGGTTATTTVANQGAGAYSMSITGGTTTAQYYQIASTSPTGLSISGTPIISSLANGDFQLSQNGGTSLTIASTVINQNPLLQIQQVRFATTTGVNTGYNVTETGTPTSNWWFRNHYGNFAGEAYDNDPGGNPGYIRWDDSGYTITVSGHVYSDHGSTAIGNPPCDGSTQSVKVVVNAATFTGSCSALTGAYSIPNVTFSGSVVLTAFLDTNGGKKAVTVTKTPTTDISDMDLYQNALVVRHEDVTPITISDLTGYDSTKDSDIFFTATTTSNLVLSPDTELVVWTGKTFVPGGNVTLQSGGSGTARDGRLYLMNNAVFTAAGTETHAIGGGLFVGTGASITTANSTFTFTATTSGKSIQSAVPLSFYNLTFVGSGGVWSLDSGYATTTVTNALSMTAGTLQGAGDLTVQSGNVTGNGTFAMTGGTVTITSTGNFGSSGAWSFNNLTFGGGSANTTTKTGAGTTTVAGVLTIAASQTLNAGSGPWVLTAGGAPFVISGTLTPASATFWYTSSSATSIANANYAGLVLAPSGAGSPTYTLSGGTPSIGSITVGDGTNGVTVTADTNDPSIAVTGNVRINTGATYIASNVGAFTVGGSWTNNGTFTNSGAQVTFNATATGKTIAAGSSSFYDLIFNSSTGGWTITQSATSTHDTTISNVSLLTLSPNQSLAVGNTFTNSMGGSKEVWATSTLYLYSGTSYTVNTKTTATTTYGTLLLGANTNIRMWNSSAATTTVPSNASLYSMNHAGTLGALNIWGGYSRSSGSDYWSYATDFDGTDISANPRKVNVSIATSSVLTFSGGVLNIFGGASASTTVQNQGSGAYTMSVSGGTFYAQYYEFRNLDLSGLQLSGTPTVSSLNNGDFLLGTNTGTTMTVAGTVIDANPLLIIRQVKFATTTAITGYNVTATGSSASFWKFNLHYGNLAGEAFDSDPAGNPGYLVWDDSLSKITVSGNVYSDEGSTVSPVCDNTTQVVKLRVEGAGTYSSSCNSSTGAYSISSISYNPGDTVTVYISTSTAHHAANVTVAPIGDIGGMDLWENRVIVRHESGSPITIAGMAQWDSTKDSAVPFTATTGSPNTLTLPPNTKLVVWNNKTFAPAGNVVIQSGGAANSYDGSLEVRAGGSFSAGTGQSHSIGGNFTIDSGATFSSANSTVTFTATTTGKTITPSTSTFYNLTFNGVGGNWAFASDATTTNNFTVSAGTVTLPTGALYVGASLVNSGGALVHNNGTVYMNASSGSNSLTLATSSLYNLTFNGAGSFTMTDTNATTSATTIITAGSVTLPSGILAVGGSFLNQGGSFTNNNGTIKFTSGSSQTVTLGGSTAYALLFAGAGSWAFGDVNATTSSRVTFQSGTATLPSGTLVVGGSFLNTGGAFANNNGTVKFVATTTGKTISPGSYSFYNLLFDAAAGGWTISQNATSTHDTTINNAAAFTLSPNTTLAVGGTFSNFVGGSQTTWATSTLYLYSGTSYTIDTKAAGGDTYGTLLLGSGMNIRMWGSSAATTTLPSNSSLYSMNHAGTSGALNIYGAYTRSSGADYWDYATDFDGVALGGSSRVVSVRIASSSSVTLSGGTLEVLGAAGATTTVANQGSGAYTFSVTGGTFNAQYYQVRNTDSSGLSLSGTPTITSLSLGDFQLGINGGTMMTIAGTVIDANASKSISSVRFATSSGITSGYNVTRTGTPNSAWTFTAAYGNYAGESYNNDGGNACGFIRWDDSSCLFVSQAHYRWRNDDGGEGALTSAWYNVSWSSRQKVAVSNPNATTYTNYPVKLTVTYDPAMKSDFSDLRFTDSSGTTTIPYFIESYTASASAVVWVSVPSLPASGSATLYAYFGNAAASDASDGSGTFRSYESFESGSLAAYSGDTSLFHIGSSFAHNGTLGLDAGTNVGQKTTTGIYRTGTQTAQGTTIRFFQYVDTTQQDEACTLFGVQSAGHNYAVCLEEFPNMHLSLAKDVTANDGSGTILASTTVTYTTGWYEVSVDWLSGGTINVTVYNPNGTVFASLSGSNNAYSSGGMGFSFWFEHGGWDYYTSRTYAASTPTGIFGGTQSFGGATWAAAEDTLLNGLGPSQNIRLRFSVQNTDTASAVNNQLLRLQIAAKGAALNCESVPHVNFNDVPTTAGGCGSSPACMTSSSQFTNQASTSPSLTYPVAMSFSKGLMLQNPSNQTYSMSIARNAATEVEYNFQMTSNATADSYCFRVSNGGSDLANYDHVPQVTVLHAPTLSNISLNTAQDISLVEGTSTNVSVTATATDLNGYADMISATSTFYRSGVGATCTADDNNCYQVASSSCTFSSCSGNSCTLTCTAHIEYLADPTDTGSTYAAQNWLSQLSVVDSTNLYTSLTSSGVDVLTLYGLTLNTQSINFGSLTPGADTGVANATTTISNTGNSPINIQLLGTDLTGGAQSIPVGQQKYATSTFAYGSCALCQYLTGSATTVAVNIAKPSSTSTPSTKDLYWGISVPVGTGASSYSGTNTFIATGG